MKNIFNLIFLIISNITFSQSNFPQENLGLKVAIIEKGNFKIIVDTVKIKNDWVSKVKITDFKDVKLNRLKILKSKTWGDKEESYYMLIAYDTSKKLKIAHWLVEKDNSLYFFKNAGDFVSDEIFYRTYFYCYGTDDDCFPEVRYMDNEYVWTGTKQTICPVDSPCKGGVVFLPYE